ncbi:hypothetical protein MASR2M70_13440 [Bacillota bacterium]
MAGVDVFYILSTGADIEVVVIGNLGSDTFIIAGEITGTVAAVDGAGNPVVLPTPGHKTGAIKGKLTLIGGPSEGADRSLSAAVTLPTETNRYIPTGRTSTIGANTLTDGNVIFDAAAVGFFLGLLDDKGQIAQLRKITGLADNVLSIDTPWDQIPLVATEYVVLFASPTLFVDESTKTDKLLIYNDYSTSDDTGELTADRITGLNMASGINAAHGIKFSGFEEFELWLGKGNDTFTIRDTPWGASTVINGGPGNDRFELLSAENHPTLTGDGYLIINGDSGNDYFNVIFDSLAKGKVTLNGNEGNDYYNLEYSPEYYEYMLLNGNGGDDTFSFADGLVLNGKINGGLGLDTIDYSRYTTARHATILGWDDDGYHGVQTGSTVGPLCSIIEGFTGIKGIIGSPFATELKGDKLHSILTEGGVWTLDGDNSIYKSIAAIDTSGQAITLNFRNYDLLYGSDMDDSFTIAGNEFGRLFGGIGNDSFIMLDGATLIGDIDGGGGDNILDYRAYTTGVRVDLCTFTATGISRSIIGINIVYGGEGDDHLIGDSGDNVLASTGGNDILEGKYGSNTYLIYEGFDAVRIIETLMGRDTLDFSNVTSELMFGFNDKRVEKVAGGLVTGTVSYGKALGETVERGDRVKTFVGGSGNSRFIFKDGLVLSSDCRVDGGPGFGIIDLSSYGSPGNVKLTGVETGGFAGEQAAIPGGFIRIDKIIGNLATDNTLTGMNKNTTYAFGQIYDVSLDEYLDYHRVVVLGITLITENYQHIIGGSADDSFAFIGKGRLAGTLDGGAGVNTLDYSAYDLGDGSGVLVDLLSDKAWSVGGALENKVKNIKAIIGSGYADQLYGDNNDNIFTGGSGNDRLEGRGGNNTYVYFAGFGEDTVIDSAGKGVLDLSGISQEQTANLGPDEASVGYGANSVIFTGISLVKTGSGNDVFKISGYHTINIESGAGNDTFMFTGSGKITGSIDGGAGDNTLDFTGCGTGVTINLADMKVSAADQGILSKFANVLTLIGSGHADSVTGPNEDSLFKITGNNAGQISWTSAADPSLIITMFFDGIESLIGGSGNDVFALTNNGQLSGTVDGGAGLNTLDFSGYNKGDGSGVEVDLLSGKATSIGGVLDNMVKNIKAIIGSDYADELYGDNNDNIFTGGKGNDKLEGRGGYNTYAFFADFGTDEVINASGTGLLDLSAVNIDLTANLTAALNTIGYGANQVSFTGINLVKTGAGNDIFNISGSFKGSLDGGSGSDRVDFSAYTKAIDIILTALGTTDGFNGTARDPSAIEAERLILSFLNIYRLTGSSSAEKDSLTGMNTPSTFRLGTQADSGATEYESGGRILSISGFEVLKGGSAADTFEIRGAKTYDLYGGGGSNTLDLSNYTGALTVQLTGLGTAAGFKGTVDCLTGFFTDIMAITAGSGSDTFKGLDADSVYVLDGNDRYTSGGRILNFGGFEILKGGSAADRFEIAGQRNYDLYGGAGNDSFVFMNGGKLTGNVRGEGGSNSLDYSAYLAGRSIRITGLGAGNNGFDGTETETISGGFFDIEKFIGSKSAKADILKGFDEASSWTLEGGKVTYKNNSITGTFADGIVLALTDIEILAGSSMGDTFAISGTVPYSLRGGAGDDIFRLTGSGTLAGNIEGGAGYNTLDLSGYGTDVTFNLGTMQAVNAAKAVIVGKFGGIEKLIGSTGQGSSISGPNKATKFRITGDNAGEVIFADSVDPAVSVTIDFEAVRNLLGGSADDIFAFMGTGRLSGAVDGGGGVNTLDYSAYDFGDESGVLVDLLSGKATSVGGDLENKVKNIKAIIGSGYADQLYGDNNDNIFTGGSGNDRLEGRGGNNTYVYFAGFGEDTVIDSAGKGVLDLSGISQEQTANLGPDEASVGYGANSVIFTGISLVKTGSGNDVFKISGYHTINIESGAGDDTFKFTGSGKVSGTVDGGDGVNILDFAGYGGNVAINLANMNVAAGDQVILSKFANIQKLIGSSFADKNDTVIGTSRDTLSSITGENSGTISWTAAANPAVTISMLFESIESLIGGSGKDTFAFTESGGLRGNISGGAGENWIDYSGVNHDALPISERGVIVNLLTGIVHGVAGLLTEVNNIIGSIYKDILTGNLANNIIRGLAGNDIIKAVAGNNTIMGGEGDDVLYGGTGSDIFVFTGNWGNDILYDNENDQGQTTGKGGHTLDFSGITANLTLTFDKSAAIDELGVTDWTNSLSYESSFPGILKAVYAGSGNDVFNLNGLSKGRTATLYGGAGNDKYNINTASRVTIDGGTGSDKVDFSAWTKGIDIVLTGHGASKGFNGQAKDPAALEAERLILNFLNINQLTGSSSAGKDSLTGMNTASTFRLGTQADSGAAEYESGGRILSFSGFEVLRGGSAADTFEVRGGKTYDLYGGAGNDIFRFMNGASLTGIADGEGGSNSLDLSDYSGKLTVELTGLGLLTGFTGTGRLTDLSTEIAGFTNITAITAGSEIDTLMGLDADSVYVLDGNDRYISGGRTLNFGGFEILKGGSAADRFEIAGQRNYDLYGGAGNDSFVFMNGGKLTGNIRGDGGSNSLDYSAYLAGRSIRITGLGAGNNGLDGTEAETISGGFFGIEKFIGSRSARTDVLKGFDEVSSWILEGGKVTYKNNSITGTFADGIVLALTDIEILAGSSMGDTFAISGSVPYSLRGGAGNDIFTLTGAGTLAGNIEGGDGYNTLDFSLYGTDVTFNLGTMQVLNAAKAVIVGKLDGIHKLIGNPGQGSSISGPNKAAKFRITGENAGELLFTDTTGPLKIDFEAAGNLLGGSADDIFAFIGKGKLSGAADGGGGVNTLDYSAYDFGDESGVLVDLLSGKATSVGGDLENKVKNIKAVIGSDFSDTLLGDNSDNVFTGGAGNDTMDGRGGSNTYIFASGFGSDTVANTLGKGTLDLSAIGEALTADLAEASATAGYGANLVNFTGISLLKTGSGNDVFNIDGTYTINIESAAGDDTFKFTDSGKVTGTLDGGEGSNTLDFTGYGTELGINLAEMKVSVAAAAILSKFANIHKLIGSSFVDKNDTVTGTNRDTLFSITGENLGTISWTSATNPAVTITMAFESIENLMGGSGNDIFKVIGTGSIRGAMNGGGGINTLDYSDYNIGNSSGVSVDLSTGSATAFGNGAVKAIDKIQTLISSKFDDSFMGHQTENNTFVFIDGWGSDTVAPGGGKNIIDFSGLTANLTIILDSSTQTIGTDTITTYRVDVNEMSGVNILNSLIVSWIGENNILSKIYGSQGANDFNLKAIYAVSLYGGVSNDRFGFDDGITLIGLIDGGAGHNTLDYSAYTLPVDITLTGPASLIGFNGSEKSIKEGFRNIDFLIGGANVEGDSLTGLNQDAVFTLDATNAGADIWNKYESAARALSLTNFEILKGGSANDTFKITGNQKYDLFGGAGNDSFVFADNARLIGNGAGQYGNLDGGAGANTLNMSDYSTSRNFYLSGLGSAAGYNGKEKALDGEFRNITAITGGETIDSINGANLVTDWHLNGVNSGRNMSGKAVLDFNSVETLNGGALEDRFKFFSGASFDGNIDGRGGIDTLDYSSLTAGIEVDLNTGLASAVSAGVTGIENVRGGSGNDIIRGDNKNNHLEGGPGNDMLYGEGGDDILDGGAENDELYGGGGNDTLITGSGHNLVSGGTGTDKVIVAYQSTYSNPANDIDVWVFLQPAPPTPGGGGGGGGGGELPPEEIVVDVISKVGSNVDIPGGKIVIPPQVLPADVTLTVRTIEPESIQNLLPGSLGLTIGSSIFEITTTGTSSFGENNYISITLEFEYSQLRFGQRPVIHYYDTDKKEWVEIDTVLKYNQETGKWEAAIKVNHLTMFAVLGTDWQPFIDKAMLDISGHWAAATIEKWLAAGLAKGGPEGLFRPDASITRAEFVALVNRVFGFSEKAEVAFNDVAAGAWYANDIAKAFRAGILAGDGNGNANPEQPITRQEAAAVLARAFKLEAKNPNTSDWFSDHTQISDWAGEAVSAMAEGGYIIGRTGNYFVPLDNITRAETVKMIDNVMGEIKNKPAVYTGTVAGNMVVNASGIELKNMVINGNLYITEGISQGNILLMGVTVKGKTIISKGMEKSVITLKQ